MQLEKYLLKFNSTKDGLTQERVEKNREVFGTNALKQIRRDFFLKILLRQFGSFFSVLLFISSIILFALNELIDFYIIIFIIIVNATIESVQRYRSDSIFEAITKNLPFYTTVVRGGKKIKIKSSEVVAGDVVVFSAGDKISADTILFETTDFKVDEAMITGESVAVMKEIKSNEYDLDRIIDNTQVAFSGSHVLTGEAKGLVVFVGSDTQIGKISQTLSTMSDELPIHKNIKKLSFYIFCVVLVLSMILLSVGLSQNQSATEIFKITVALFVSAIPESLPMMLTLVLAYGFKRMSNKNVLVRKMQSLDVLGQINTLALDKTGTITSNQMKVEKIFTPYDGEFYVTGEGYEPVGNLIQNDRNVDVKDFESLYDLLFAGTNSSMGSYDFNQKNDEWELITGDPTEVALLVLAEKFKIKTLEESDLILKKDIPFSNTKKYHESVYEKNNKEVRYITGAPEVVLEKSSYMYAQKDTVIKMEDAQYELFHNKIREYSQKGYRTIASSVIENNKTIFIGFFVINDSIRKDVFESVSEVQKQGIRIVMITGDHPDIALQIAQKVGIMSGTNMILTGEDMLNLTDIQLKTIIKNKNIFARVTPAQKLKILELLKKNGGVVAMTGDGINDSLALLKADIGIAMGKSSSDVAKEASDIVLLDNKFGSIVYGIEEGKNIFSNINKIILFLLSTNFAEMFVVMMCVILFLPLPLSAASILWLNLVTDTFLVIGFAFERGAHDKKSNTLISRHDWLRIFYLGFCMTLISLIVFVALMDKGMLVAQSYTLLLLIIMQWFNVLNIKAGNTASIFKIKFDNSAFVIGYIISIGLTIFAFNSAFMNKILEIQPIGISGWLYLILIGSSIIWFEELRKLTQK